MARRLNTLVVEDPDNPGHKVCARCDVSKPFSEFGKNPRMRIGLKSYCRMCTNALQRDWSKRRRAKIAAIQEAASLEQQAD